MAQFRGKLILACVLAALLVVGAAAARLTYRNFRIATDIDQVEAEIAALEREKEEVESAIAGIQDVASLERAAREQLNLQREGEKVVILLPTGEEEVKPEETAVFVQKEPNNPEKWWKFFFAE